MGRLMVQTNGASNFREVSICAMVIFLLQEVKGQSWAIKK